MRMTNRIYTLLSDTGKSTLINSLIGTNLLKSGVLPTTSKICIVRHENDSVAGGGNLWKQADNMLYICLSIH